MRCYTWENGELKDGVEVQHLGPDHIVYLGHDPQVWKPRYISLHQRNPAEVLDDDLIYDAYPVSERVENASPGVPFVLAKPDPRHEGDVRCLIVVSTFCEDVHALDSGFWRTLSGRAETIASGVVREDGKGYWKRGLIRLAEGESVHISVADPYAEDFVLALENGTLHTYNWLDYFGDEE